MTHGNPVAEYIAHRRIRPPLPEDFGLTTEKIQRVEAVLRRVKRSGPYLYFGSCVLLATLLAARTGGPLGRDIKEVVEIAMFLAVPVGIPLVGLRGLLRDKPLAVIPGFRRTRDFQEAVAQYERAQWAAQQQLSIEANDLEQQERDRLQRERLREVDGLLQLTPREFEHAIAQLYEAMGYAVEVTPAVNDEGRDVVATRPGEHLYIECKRYGVTHAVGRPGLQKLVGALPNASVRGVFVTTSSFSGPAREYAKARGVELVDGKALTALLRRTFGERRGVSEVQVMCRDCGQILLFPLAGGVQASRCAMSHAVKFDPSNYAH